LNRFCRERRHFLKVDSGQKSLEAIHQQSRRTSALSSRIGAL
jgi:hypothetical protein